MDDYAYYHCYQRECNLYQGYDLMASHAPEGSYKKIKIISKENKK